MKRNEGSITILAVVLMCSLLGCAGKFVREPHSHRSQTTPPTQGTVETIARMAMTVVGVGMLIVYGPEIAPQGESVEVGHFVTGAGLIITGVGFIIVADPLGETQDGEEDKILNLMLIMGGTLLLMGSQM